MSELKSRYLVETGWLQDHLGDPELRILDCTVFLRPGEGGVRLESGRAQWEQAACRLQEGVVKWITRERPKIDRLARRERPGRYRSISLVWS